MSEQIEQSVIVEKTEGGYAWVSTTNVSGCSSCSSKSACGSANLLKPLIDAKNRNIKVRNTLNADIGDEVVVELSSTVFLKGTFLAYLFPLFLLFAGALFGKVFWGEAGSALLGIGGLFTGLYLVKFIITDTPFKNEIEPVMVCFEEGQENNNEHTIQLSL